MSKEVKFWFTTKTGKHVPVFEGETKQEALKRSFTDSVKKIKKEPSASKENSESKTTSNSNSFVRTNKTDADTFSKAIHDAKNSQADEIKWRVSAYESEHYKNAKCFKTDDGSTVAVSADGDIISVCASGSAIRGTGTKLMQTAIDNGGVKLDSFDGNHGFYTKMGFEPISYTPFSEYALDEEDRKLWKKTSGKPEHVIFYAYVGKDNVKYAGKEGLERFYQDADKNGWRFDGDNGYDEAQKFRDKKIKRR